MKEGRRKDRRSIEWKWNWKEKGIEVVGEGTGF
jgi:hypothetical protein